MNNKSESSAKLNNRHKTREERLREIRAARGASQTSMPSAGGQKSDGRKRAQPGREPGRDRRVGSVFYAQRPNSDRRTAASSSYERQSGSGRRSDLASTRRSGADRRPAASSVRRTGAGRRRRHSGFPYRALLLLLPLLAAVLVIVLLVRHFAEGIGPDTTPPVITLQSNPDYTVMPGQTYREEGFTATDDRDGDLTDRVERTEEDDRICYRVSDSAGNVTVSYRDIPYAPGSDPSLADAFVQDGEAASGGEAADKQGFSGGGETDGSAEGKVVYLTFDDGPGQYTQKLLDTLAKYDAHVTFFVTGSFPVYEDMIKKEFDAGHSIGIHTFTHDYDKIYASPEAFWKDNAKMQEVVVRQTGQSTNLMRFAGGSSNTMAVWQSPDIMENLVNQAAGKGFQYFDWNVSSGDGAAEGDSAMVISKITDQIRNFDESVVLCHDTKEYTVNAMEYLIPWLLDNGYTLRPLTVDSEPAHHIDPD